MLLSYSRLQTLLHERWDFVLPSHFVEFVQTSWFGEQPMPGPQIAATAARDKPATPWWDAEAERVHSLRVVWEYVAALGTNLGLVLMIAPLEAAVDKHRARLMSAARFRVEARNPPPRGFVDGHMHYFLDGVKLGTALEIRSAKEHAKRETYWQKRRSHHMEQE